MAHSLDEAAHRATRVAFEHYVSGASDGATIAGAVLQIRQLHGDLVPPLLRRDREAPPG